MESPSQKIGNSPLIFLLPGGRPFSLATGLGLTPVDAHTLLVDKRNGSVRTLNGGGGSDKLSGPNFDEMWTISGAGNGMLGNLVTFTGLHDLVGEDLLDLVQRRLGNEAFELIAQPEPQLRERPAPPG